MLGLNTPVIHRVLAVHNGDGNRYTRARALRAAGFEVIDAEKGVDALRLAAEKQPSLIFLDGLLPDMNSVEVCRHLKSDPETRMIPVLHVSFGGAEQDITELSDHGFDAYLHEPLEPAALVATVTALIQAREAERRRPRCEEAVRRASEQRLQRLLETEAFGVIFFDSTGTIIDANEAFLRMTGYTRAEVERRELTWWRLTPEEWIPASEAQLQKLAATGRIGPYEKEYFFADGSRRWMLFAGRDLGDGTLAEHCIDISDRKEAERELLAAKERLSADLAGMIRLYNLYERLMHAGSLEASLDEILATAVEFTGTDRGSVQLVTEDGGLSIAVRRGQGSAFLEHFGFSGCPTACETALRLRERVIIEDLRADPRLAGTKDLEVMVGERIRGIQSTPLIAREGRVLGVLSTHFTRPHRPNDAELRMLDLLASLASDFIVRAQAEAALRESEQRFRALLRAASDGIHILDEKGNVVEVNDAFCRMLGYTREELLGLNVRDWDAQLSPEELAAKLDEVIAGSRVFETRHRCKDGTVRDVEIGGVGVTLENRRLIYASARDITERKRAEEMLRASERHFRELADLMPQLVWVADETGSITYANRQWSEQIGAPVEQCLGDGWLTFLHAEDVERSLAALRRSVETGAVYQIEHRFRVRSGEYRWYLGRGVPIRDEQGRVTRWFGTSTDIEDSKRAEERLRQAQRLESIGLLAAGIAHDFNNIMAGIMGNASLVLDEVGPGPAEQIRAVISGAERAAHLTKQLLAYSGKGQFLVRDLDISEAASRAVELVRPSLPRSVELTMNVSKGIPGVCMDPGQLEQILVNLIINAGEAFEEGKPGKITVGISMTDIDKQFVDARGEEIAAGRYASIEVHDTGVGIADHVRSRIFDPFFTTKFLGRGLGLAAVAGIVRANKGGITIDSVPGRGSSFRVLLPVGERPAEQPEARSGAKGRATVLVVDDEADVRGFIAAVLRRQGYRALTASDGKEALAVCERESWEVDAAVIDVVMPVMSAKQLLPKIKERRPKMKVLLTSAYDHVEAARLCSYSGAAFIQKPYTAQQLTEAIDKLLGASDREDRAKPPRLSAGRR